MCGGGSGGGGDGGVGIGGEKVEKYEEEQNNWIVEQNEFWLWGNDKRLWRHLR